MFNVYITEVFLVSFFVPGERQKRAIGAGCGGEKQCHDPTAFLHVESWSDI